MKSYFFLFQTISSKFYFNIFTIKESHSWSKLSGILFTISVPFVFKAGLVQKLGIFGILFLICVFGIERSSNTRYLVFKLYHFCVVISLFEQSTSIGHLLVNILLNLLLKTLFVRIILCFVDYSACAPYPSADNIDFGNQFIIQSFSDKCFIIWLT